MQEAPSFTPREFGSDSEENVAVIDKPEESSISSQHDGATEKPLSPQQQNKVLVYFRKNAEYLNELIEKMRKEEKLTPKESQDYKTLRVAFTLVKKWEGEKKIKRPPLAPERLLEQQKKEEVERYIAERTKKIQAFFDAFERSADRKFERRPTRQEKMKKIKDGIEAYRKSALEAITSPVRLKALDDALTWAGSNDILFVGRHPETRENLRIEIQKLDAKIFNAKRMSAPRRSA